MNRRLVGVVAALALTGSVIMAVEAEKKPATLDNMQKAFENGSLAKARCEAFAAKAEEEGYKSVVALFKASARAESIHLEKYAKVIKALGAEARADVAKPEVKSTRENLEVMIKAIEVNASTYAGFAKQAALDKNDMAAMFLNGALADEASRGKIYQQAVDGLKSWKTAGKQFIVCLVCGYTTTDLKLKACPVCSAPRSKFVDFK